MGVISKSSSIVSPQIVWKSIQKYIALCKTALHKYSYSYSRSSNSRLVFEGSEGSRFGNLRFDPIVAKILTIAGNHTI